MVAKEMKRCLTLISCILLAGWTGATPTEVWLWQENSVRPVADKLTQRLASRGFNVVPKSTKELAEATLKPGAPDVILLPCGESYPATLGESLLQYTAQGGAMVVTGGQRSFVQPCYPTAQGVCVVDEAVGEVLWDDTTSDWHHRMLGEGDTVDTLKSGEVTSLAFKVKNFAYAGMELSIATDCDAVVELQLRTPEREDGVVSLEFQERGGVRWKYVVLVTDKWQTHRVHLAQLSPYNQQAHKVRTPWLRVERVNRFYLGMLKSMNGDGEHLVEVRGLRLVRSTLPADIVAQTAHFVPERLSVTHWFGERQVDGARELATPLLRDMRTPAKLGEQPMRRTNFDYQKGRWIVLDLVYKDDLTVLNEICESLHLLQSSLIQRTPELSFRVADNRVVMDVEWPVMNPMASDVRCKARLVVNGKVAAKKVVELPARGSRLRGVQLAQGLPAPALDLEPLELRVEVEDTTLKFFGGARFSVDVKAQLRAVCDFMLATAGEDGLMHGYSFIDNRGVRVLLAGYELFGDRRYLECAMRWGKTMIAQQRTDGGYRMGYGITTRGEECYVADGGEIVVGVLRLAECATAQMRVQLLASADRYMAYRESFRVAEGGIGVGWCLSDYSQRPIKPLQTPTRIFAPEINTYTIGCSLAGAYTHATLRNGDELLKRAWRDVQWLMPRTTKLNGAFVESYVFAHRLEPDAARKAELAEYLGRAFIEPTLAKKQSWWLQGNGRSALNLYGIAYCRRYLSQRQLELTAEHYRALCGMFSAEVPRSIPETLTGTILAQPEWLYISYGSLGLAETVAPTLSSPAALW